MQKDPEVTRSRKPLLMWLLSALIPLAAPWSASGGGGPVYSYPPIHFPGGVVVSAVGYAETHPGRAFTLSANGLTSSTGADEPHPRHILIRVDAPGPLTVRVRLHDAAGELLLDDTAEVAVPIDHSRHADPRGIGRVRIDVTADCTLFVIERPTQ